MKKNGKREWLHDFSVEYLQHMTRNLSVEQREAVSSVRTFEAELARYTFWHDRAVVWGVNLDQRDTIADADEEPMSSLRIAKTICLAHATVITPGTMSGYYCWVLGVMARITAFLYMQQPHRRKLAYGWSDVAAYWELALYKYHNGNPMDRNGHPTDRTNCTNSNVLKKSKQPECDDTFNER